MDLASSIREIIRLGQHSLAVSAHWSKAALVLSALDRAIHALWDWWYRATGLVRAGGPPDGRGPRASPSGLS